MSTYGSRPLYSPMSGVSTSSRTSKDADTTADVATPSKLDMTVTGKTASDLIRLQKKRLKGVRKALEEAKRKVKLLSAREKEEEKVTYIFLTRKIEPEFIFISRALYFNFFA
eukprot:comp13445_c0_seq4/m.18598 comp13445_c0_seq4/g.18598  ORF comp13445_c0_seq4/g.18598 comp13445_c0_seq4/m.18598 type:complete len:112 (-) comp13445_c0_seq4:39-374(-)